MKHITHKIKMIAAMGMMMLTQFVSAELVVIVNEKSPIDNLSKKEISNLYLGKQFEFKGAELIPIDQIEGDENRVLFYKQIVGKSPSQLTLYWSKRVYTGKGNPPKEYFNDDEIVSIVANNVNLVGYVDSDSVKNGVKVIYTSVD